MKSLAKLLISISIFGIVFGFLNLFLFQTTFGVIEVGESSTSNTFHLKKGFYSINAIGENQAWGFSSGEVSLVSTDGSSTPPPVSISFSFDGEASISTVMVASITIEEEGDYYFRYDEYQSNTVGTVKIALQQSTTAGLLGIDELTFIVYSVGFLTISIIISAILSFSSRDRAAAPNYTPEYNPIREQGDFVFDDSSSYSKKTRMVTCPLCGTRSDGLFCEKCGTNLR
jgi:hypothetical protein